MKRIDVEAVASRRGSGYPAPFDIPCSDRERRRLGEAAGLTQFGVNLLRMPPGTWSSQRHWHEGEDEFVMVLEGELVLVTEAGEEVLRVGDCAGFRAGDADGHHLQNRSTQDAVVLEVGARAAGGDGVDYPDIDLRIMRGVQAFVRKDGTLYPPKV